VQDPQAQLRRPGAVSGEEDMVRADELVGRTINRRKLLVGAAAAGIALPMLQHSGFRALADVSTGKVVWVSPRGTLEVLDDYPYWVAQHFGWFGDLETEILPSIMEATSSEKAVADGQADMSYVSPGVFTFGVEAGVDLVSVFQMGAADVFDIAVQKGSDITSVADLEGKTIILGDAGWQGIVDPMLIQAGIEPATVKYAAAGSGWGQALAEGQGDAALCWAGLRAQWKAQGLDFDYIIGSTWSKFPANSFQIRRADFENADLAATYTEYLKGWAMGLQFGYLNPRAATQITMQAEPIAAALQETFKDKADVAVESMWQLANVFRGADFAARDGGKWGWADMEGWQLFLDDAFKAGNLTEEIDAATIIFNDYVAGANEFDAAVVQAAADEFVLDPEFEAVAVPEGAGA